MAKARTVLAMVLVLSACRPHDSSSNLNACHARSAQLHATLLLLRGGSSGDPYNLQERKQGASLLASLIRSGDIKLHNLNVSGHGELGEEEGAVDRQGSEMDADVPERPDERFKAAKVEASTAAEAPRQKDEAREPQSGYTALRQEYDRQDEERRDLRGEQVIFIRWRGTNR